MRLLIALLFALLTSPVTLRAESVTFAVAGDSRTDVTGTSTDPTGINSKILKKALVDVAKKKPLFLLFTGDLVYGENLRIPAKIAEQLTAWKQLVQESLPGIPVLPVRGNHELNGDPKGTAWQNAFRQDLEENKVTNFPLGNGLSYSYSPPGHPEIAVIAADQYLPGMTHRVDLAGLEAALKQAKEKGAKYLFVFSHEMAFTCGMHPSSDNMAAFPSERDKFVDLLRTYGCEYFFAGHDHLYDWMEIRNWRWPKDYHLNQIVAGTAGAPFYSDKTDYHSHDGYDLCRLDHKLNTYGYLLVTVEKEPKEGEKPVTVSFVTINP